jgi:hypothetical protein
MIPALLLLTVINTTIPPTDTNDMIKFTTPNTVIAADGI